MVDKTEGIVMVSVSDFFVESGLVFKVSLFVKTEYSADVLNTDQSA